MKPEEAEKEAATPDSVRPPSPCSTINKAKGVAKVVVKRLKFDVYKEALEGKRVVRAKVPGIRAFDYRMYKITSDRRVMSTFDDKSWLMACGHHSLSYGDSAIPIWGTGDTCPICEGKLTL